MAKGKEHGVVGIMKSSERHTLANYKVASSVDTISSLQPPRPRQDNWK